MGKTIYRGGLPGDNIFDVLDVFEGVMYLMHTVDKYTDPDDSVLCMADAPEGATLRDNQLQRLEYRQVRWVE